MERTTFSNLELSVLQLLSERCIGAEIPIQTREISELAIATGIKNNEDIQRALYILEGKSLVCPDPNGDLTSKQWKITDIGRKALEFFDA